MKRCRKYFALSCVCITLLFFCAFTTPLTHATSQAPLQSQEQIISDITTSETLAATPEPVSLSDESSLSASEQNDLPSSSSVSSELTSDNINNIVVFDLLGQGIKIQNLDNKITGIIAWVAIILVIGLILFSVFKRRKQKKIIYTKASLGKTRYRKKTYKRSKKRHLLSDTHYNSRKYK